MIKCDLCDNRAQYQYQQVFMVSSIDEDDDYHIISEKVDDDATSYLCRACEKKEYDYGNDSNPDTLFVEVTTKN